MNRFVINLRQVDAAMRSPSIIGNIGAELQVQVDRERGLDDDLVQHPLRNPQWYDTSLNIVSRRLND